MSETSRRLWPGSLLNRPVHRKFDYITVTELVTNKFRHTTEYRSEGLCTYIFVTVTFVQYQICAGVPRARDCDRKLLLAVIVPIVSG